MKRKNKKARAIGPTSTIAELDDKTEGSMLLVQFRMKHTWRGRLDTLRDMSTAKIEHKQPRKDATILNSGDAIHVLQHLTQTS